MAPSSGHISVPNAMKALKYAVSRTATFLRSKLPQPSTTSTTSIAILEPIPIRVRQPIRPIAVLRQCRSQQCRWFSTARNLSSINATLVPLRSSLPVSRVSQTIARSGRAPFSSALRPNLTGGCLPRTAGGYSLGGGAGGAVRHFSHTPAVQAQVVNNVSAAVRAFWLSGQKACFDGVEGKTGEKKWKSVSFTQDKVRRTMNRSVHSTETKGTSVEFSLVPTITTLSPCAMVASFSAQAQTIDTDTLSGLASDFARALKDLSVILADLKRLSVLGDLPITIDDKSAIKVHFPGCDARVVESLCDELGVRHGIVREDADWRTDKDAQMALLFPLAPNTTESEADSDIGAMFSKDLSVPRQREQVEWQSMISAVPSERMDTRPNLSTRSITSDESWEGAEADSLWTLQEGYESSDYGGYENAGDGAMEGGKTSSQDYEGVEGLYKFLSACEGGSRRAATADS